MKRSIDKNLNYLWICLAFIIISYWGYQEHIQSIQQPYGNAEVEYVIDGDTFWALMIDDDGYSYREKIRLHGLNTPELSGPDALAGYEAKEALKRMIEDHNVLLQDFDGHRGKYNRLIAIVYVVQGQDTVNVNEFLVHNNYAEPRDYGMGSIKINTNK